MVNQLRQVRRLLGKWAVGLFLLTGMIFLCASPVEAGIGAITEYNLNSSSWPEYIAAGPDGNLWFTDKDSGTPAIGKVNSATGEITRYSAGLNSGSTPDYIVAGPDGNLWFTDWGSTRAIGRIDPSTGAITEYSTGLNSGSWPNYIATGPDGNLWFTDNGSIKAIGKIDRATGAITEYSTGLTGSDLNIIVAGPDGNLWFTDNGSTRAIGRIDPATGGITKYTTGLNSGSILTVIVAGPDGNLWFTEGGTTPAIGKVNPATGEINEYTTGLNGSSLPNYIVAGPDGNLWFTDNGSTKAIGRIDPVTGAITEFSTGSGSGNLYNIVAGPDGSLWASDYGTSTIYRVNSNTGAVTAYPTDVFGFGWPTFFLALGPDGNLWFTDSCTPAIGKVYVVVPAVTAVSPANGPVSGGTTVTITGSGFTGATAVSFGGVAAGSFTVNSATSITAISPAHEAGTVDVTVNTPGGTSTTGSAGQFTYTPPITTGTISGTVKDSNNNLVSGASVSLTVSGSVYSAQTAANGAYSILNVPAGTGYTVTASKAGFQDRTASSVTVTAGSTTTGVDFILYIAVDDSSISPTSVTFDKNSANTGAGHYADIHVTITFNGNTLLSIMNGSVPLVENTDYTVSGSVYSISKTYLVGQSLGTTTLTFNFSAGSPQSLTITIGDSTPTTHTVRVSANPPAGGLVSGGGTYEEGASVIVTATPNSGYSFVNWTEGGVQVITSASYTFTLGTSDRTPVANFAANPTYTVTFDSQGGSSVSSINNVTSGSTISAPTAPTKTGYTFGGWYKESSCTNAWNFSTDTVTGNITLYAKWTYNGGGGGGSSTPTPTPEPTAQVLASNGNLIQSITASQDKSTGIAAIEVNSATLTSAFDRSATDDKGVKTVVIDIQKIYGAKAYEPTLPASFLSAGDASKAVEIKTGVATVTIPGNMLNTAAAAGAQNVSLTIAIGDKSKLDAAVRAQIGDRPVIELNLKVDGKQTAWNNDSAPVTVTVPYTPTAEELANPESIVIWYIDGSGKAISVPNGRYDPATGTVTFTTTHFSYYAVNYNKVNFKDVAASAWYSKAVGFIAARGITTGTGSGNYSPDAKLTRGQFIVMLMKAYGIAPDANQKDNFADAGSTWYTGYLAAAKRLGISSGVGNNMFAPGKEITRQEMFTLLYNVLKVIGSLPQGASGKALSDFSDANEIASWAKDAMTLMVGNGTISGNGGKLSPASTTTRAEMAQVLYNLLSK
ncbi:MAG: virginiamycin B lyase family protein [Eubacteriales bacterium]